MTETPKTKRLYIVRHGETDYNKQGMVQGRGIDAPLNELGQRQAEAFFEYYQDQPFDKIYISELQRTQQSIQLFIDKGLPFEKLAGLDEISWGSQEGVRFSKESENLYKSTIARWKAGHLEEAVAGGESPIDVMNRQKKAMDHILGQSGERRVLICMHGRAIRILMAWLLGYDLSYMDEFRHANLGLYKLFYTGKSFQLEAMNETDHLKILEVDE